MGIPSCQCTIQQSASSVLHLAIGGTVADMENKFHLLEPSCQSNRTLSSLEVSGLTVQEFIVCPTTGSLHDSFRISIYLITVSIPVSISVSIISICLTSRQRLSYTLGNQLFDDIRCHS
ncbi:hypothetical protein Tco_1394203 [Tanacetum coccineum]